MATIKVSGIGVNQFGGVESCGNITSYRATLATDAAGVPLNSNSTAALAIGTIVVLNVLPAGMLLEDAQIIVSNAMTASTTGSLGFLYSDGVNSAEVPQDAAYFGSGIALSTVARLRCTAAKAPVTLPKDANLVLTIAGAASDEASRLDVIVHGERLGY